MTSAENFTRLLNRAAEGDHDAAQVVLPRVLDELRAMARRKLAALPPGQTLQPTALVNEVWLRLSEGDQSEWEGRRHFRFVAARAMRDILVEDARRKGSQKRGGDRRRVEIEDFHLIVDTPVHDILALDTALKKLETVDSVGAQVVMLRFFSGLEMTEVAETLDVSLSTVERKWRFVRAWLKKELDAES